MSFWRVVAGLALLAGMAAALPADRGELERWEAIEDSLQQMPPRLRGRWLRGRGLPDPMLRPATVSTDSGLSVAGRWSYGPATFVTVDARASDTFAYLSRGSGVSLTKLQTTDSLRLELLADINCAALTGRLTVQGNRLFTGAAGLETYDITDPTRPSLIARFPFVAYDYFIDDTFLYTVGSDSFKVYSIADPASLRPLGACRDSGYVLFKAGNCAYLGHQYGLYILDVSDPAQPRRVATLGYDVVGIRVRDSFCYVSTYDSAFHVVNVANPAAPFPVGQLRGVEPGYLVTVATNDTVVYTPAFDIISTANPAVPRRVGGVRTPGWSEGVAVAPDLRCALVADQYEGLKLIDIGVPAAPVITRTELAAAQTVDICIDDPVAYVANERAGFRILDVSDVAHPYALGALDSVYSGLSCLAAVGRDSFAYIGWFFEFTRSVDVSNPRQPVFTAQFSLFRNAEAMILRDSFLYVAEDYRLQVVNVARPREPRVVGTVNLPGMSYDMALRDTVAYVANQQLRVVNVARPTSPYVLAEWPGRAYGVDVVDTLLYVTGSRSINVLSVANPAAPRFLDSLPLGTIIHDVVVVDTIAYCAGFRLHQVSVSDPANLREVGEPWDPPSWIRRIIYSAPNLYACCTDGGLVILEQTPAGISEGRTGAEARQAGRAWPSVTRGRLSVSGDRTGRWEVLDVSGRRVLDLEPGENDVSKLAPGVYILRQCSSGPVVEWSSEKIVITR
jgi:hypothetical protein